LPAIAGAGLSNLLGFALVSFCSLQAFRRALDSESEMVAFQSLVWRGRELGSPLLSEPPEKSSQSLPSPQCPAALCAHPAYDQVFLSLALTRWGVSKPSRSLWCAPVLLLPGEEEESPRTCCLLGPCWRSRGPTVLWITVYGNPELRARASAPSLQPASPLQHLGALPHSGTLGLSVTPRALRPHCPSEGSSPRLATGVTSLSRADF